MSVMVLLFYFRTSVATRCCQEMLTEDFVEVACVVVADSSDDMLYRKLCGGEQEGSLIQTLLLQQLFEGKM